MLIYSYLTFQNEGFAVIPEANINLIFYCIFKFLIEFKSHFIHNNMNSKSKVNHLGVIGTIL